MMRHYLILALVLASVYSCQKTEKDTEDTAGSISMTFTHYAGNDSLIMEEQYYQNAAGNEYRVTFLKFFVSGLTLYRNGSRVWYSEAPPTSINAKYTEYCQALFKNIPEGNYDSLSLAIGVVPEYNFQGSFEMSYKDYNMYWPDNLGGGYHFIKFEGHWRDGQQIGMFAFHLGGNENLFRIGFPLSLKISASKATHMKMIMNTNEWFENPYLYDLTKEGGYTMGDTIKMNHLVQNGRHAFSLKLDEY